MAKKVELTADECLNRLETPTINLVEMADQPSLQRTNLHDSLLQIARLSQLESASLVRQVVSNALGKIPSSEE